MNVLRRSVVVAAVAVVCLAALAEAQPPGRQAPGRQGPRPGFMGRGGFGMNLLNLAQNPAIQKDMECLEDQVAKINALAEELRAERAPRPQGERPDFRSMSDEERQKFFAEMRQRWQKRTETANAKLGEILLKPQMKRLRGISVQLRGVSALTDSELATQLKLSESQSKKIEETIAANRESMFGQMREMFRGGERGAPREGDREEFRKKMQELRKQGDEKVLAILTSEQKEQFEKIKGDPFEMPEGGFRRPGGQRRPGEARGEGQPRGERLPRGERPPRGEQGGRRSRRSESE